MKKKVGIIGTGRISKYLANRLTRQEIDVCFSLGKNQIEELRGFLRLHRPLAVFLTISTLDKGEAARDYILICMEFGIPVITCEKGALAYHAHILKTHMRDIGYSAAVGGGTRMLTYLKSRDFTNTPVEIQAVLNGTLNFILDAMRHQGKSLSQACEEAGTLGYAEPGATNALALINGELKDVCMKACTLFNTTLTQQEVITPNNLNIPTYRDCDFDRLSKDGAEHRFVVSFSNQGKFKQYPYSGSKFGPIKINDWYITGSFQYITWAMQSAGWLPGKVGNAIHIIEGEPGIESVYTLSGPGAGYEPTTSAMLADFRDLCG